MIGRTPLLICVAAFCLVFASFVFCQQPGDVYMWEFNEGTGTTTTDNSGQFTASLGVPLDPAAIPESSADSPSGKTGDRSIRVNGGLSVDDSVDPVLAIQEGPITMEAWIKLEDLAQYNGILAYGASYKMGINGGYFVWTFYGIEDVFSQIPMEADQVWHHIAMAWEPGTGVTFYFDGVESDFVETTNVPRPLQNNILNIGSETAGNVPMIGLLDRARIHHAVLDETELDSDHANPKPPLEKTVVAYNFDEAQAPYENATGVSRPAISTVEFNAAITRPMFSSDTPSAQPGDYSLYFDGNDRVIYIDEQDILQFEDEDFTFEAWVKFNAADQVSARPVLLAYGVGGQNGYSFSFRAAGERPIGVDDSPSGKPGDRSVHPKSGLIVDDSDNPILAIHEGPITMEAWVKLDSLSGWTDIARYGDAYKFGFHTNGNLVWTFLTVEDVDSGVPAIVDQNWHHIVMAWTPGVGVDFYYDGQLVSFVETSSTNREPPFNALNIGTSSTGTSALKGLIDRLRIHHAVLDASQLDSDPANPKPPLESTIVAYNFDEQGVPYQSATAVDRPAVNRSKGSTITVTTFGIIDAHSEVAIPDDGQWHHIAAAHEMGKEFRFYVDGKLGEVMPYDSGVMFAEVYEFYIGSERGGGHPYVGLLDRVRITRAALTETELDYFQPVGIEDWPLF